EVAGGIELRRVAAVGTRVDVRQSRAPAMARANVAAGVHEHIRCADTVAIAHTAREAVAVADLCAELEELVARREPFHLCAVGRVLAAEERLVRERRIVEV